MFIKEAYERRLKKETIQEDEGDILQLQSHKINTIGSIKNGKISYDKDEQFFSKEDVPAKARQHKEQIKQFIDPDLLGLRKKEWLNSVSVPKNPLAEETHERKLIKIKLGLFDHPITKYKENVIYQGTETRDNYTNWNVSNEINKNERINQLAKMLQFKVIKSYYRTDVAKQHNKDREADLIRNYIKPIEVQNLMTDQLRHNKSQEKELREQIRQEFMFTNPTASKEKADGAIFRLAYETKIRKNQQINFNSDMTFKADLSKTMKNDIKFKYDHTGIWSTTKERQDNGTENIIQAWSCCMNEEYKSRGCNIIKIDKKKWNLVSFNS